MAARVLVHLHIVIPKAALFVGQRTIDQLLELLNAERFESKNLRARDQRAVHIKERIVSSRTNQAETPSFDVRQKDVLLRFIEMMDLIDEQDRLLPRRTEAIRRRSDHAAHFGDVAFHAADANEFRVRHLRNDPRQGGLAAAGWSGENH